MDTKINKINDLKYRLNRNGHIMGGNELGVDGIHAPPTLIADKPFLDFCTLHF